jgi:hypothetical protein
MKEVTLTVSEALAVVFCLSPAANDMQLTLNIWLQICCRYDLHGGSLARLMVSFPYNYIRAYLMHANHRAEQDGYRNMAY